MLFILGTLLMAIPASAQFHPQSDPYGGMMPQGGYDPMAAAPVMQPYAQNVAYSQQESQGYYGAQGYYPQQYANSNCPCPNSCCDNCGLFPSEYKRCGKWFLCGWLDQSYTTTADDSFGHNGVLKFNDLADEYMLNQLYLSMGRSVTTSGCNFDFGGRIDMMYGTDYLFASANGLEARTNYNGTYQTDPAVNNNRWNSNKGSRIYDPWTGDSRKSRYGLALPQFYTELNLPFGCGLNVKAGHFYSPMGYESVMAPQNFFYSHSYSMMYGDAMTYTGVLFNQKMSNRFSLLFGVTRGWDMFEDPNGKLSYLGGFQWQSCDKRTNVSFVMGTGNESLRTNYITGEATSQEGAIRTHYSLVVSRQMTDRLKYVFQHNYGHDKADYVPFFGAGSYNGEWYSLNNYFFYQLTQTTEFGLRVEWFRDRNNTRIADSFGLADGDDYSELTLGLNWKPCCWLNVRPEARWDWCGLPLFDEGTSKNMFTAGLSTTIMF